MENRLFVATTTQQIAIEYEPESGKTRVLPNGNWGSLRATRRGIVGTVKVAAGNNANVYACFHCSNCATPIQAVRRLGIPGLRLPDEEAKGFSKLFIPAPFIKTLNDGVCWHGGTSCQES